MTTYAAAIRHRHPSVTPQKLVAHLETIGERFGDPALLDELERYRERAAIMEYHGCLPRDEAEAAAVEFVWPSRREEHAA